MADIPQNTTYGTVGKASYDLAKTLKAPVQATQPTQPVQQKTYAPTYNNLGKQNLGVITTPYGGSTKFEKVHPGVDIAAPKGTEFSMNTLGKDVGNLKIVENKSGTTGWGNTILAQDNNGMFYRFSHLNNAYVKVGDVIDSNTILGSIGSSGSTYSPSGKGDGSHLDWRIFDAAGKYYNPLSN